MNRPNSYPELIATFGDPSPLIREDGSVNPKWEIDNMGFAQLPMPLPLSWLPDKLVSKIYCHRFMVPIFTDVFAEIHRIGAFRFLQTYGGCYNWRTKRGQGKLSTHCWGISVDLNPVENGLGTYGNMAQEVVDVFKEYNFVWGGDWKPKAYCDPMHFQYVSGY